MKRGDASRPALPAATRDTNRALGDTLIAQERADVEVNRFDVRVRVALAQEVGPLPLEVGVLAAA